MTHDDLQLDGPDRDLADRLQRERPVPRPAFRGMLRRRLADDNGPRPLPILGWRWVVLSGASGVALLAIAAAGLAGVGPGAV